LVKLYQSPATGAVTVRTSLLKGFPHDPNIHQYIYFDVRFNTVKDERSPNANSTLNTLGYSPTPLSEYITIIERIVSTNKPLTNKRKKPFIVSVTGTSDEIIQCHKLISECRARISHPLHMEINLSCPNIPNKPPPAYSSFALQEYLFALQRNKILQDPDAHVLVGIKTPPYTYHDQFQNLIDALLATTADNLKCPVDFITATNTLGSCLVLSESEEFLAPSSEPGSFVPAAASASGTGIGGVGGAALHAIALGNVRTIRMMLDKHVRLAPIEIIGVGGVADYPGYARFLSIGAVAVGVGTALGKDGPRIFQKILAEVEVLQMLDKMQLRGNAGEKTMGKQIDPDGKVVEKDQMVNGVDET